MVGGEGSDNMQGGRGNDVLMGNDGNDFLFGEGGRDILLAGAGDDHLEGSWGRDIMDGGTGNDTFFIDGGFDIVTGGADADTYAFMDNTCGATILDWEDGLDMIDFSRAENVASIEDLTIVQTSAMTATISFANDSGKEVEVELISASAFELTQDDLFFG